MPEEFDSEAGTPGNRLAISRKARELPVVERMIGRLGAGEVAHHQRDAVIAGVDARDEALRFRKRQAEPVHAGVDVQRRAAGPAAAAAEGVPFGEFVEIADHRPARRCSAKAAPLPGRSRRARRSPPSAAAARTRRASSRVGDEERLAAGAGERARRPARRRSHRRRP